MTTINDAFRFELDLTVEQRDLAARSAGTARFAWNWALAERRRLFTEHEGKARFTTAFSQINAWVKAKPAWAYEVSAWCAVSAISDVDKAYKKFWKDRKAGRKTGLPRFKVRGKAKDAFRLRGTIKVLDERHVQLPTFEAVRIKGSTRRMSAIGWSKILCATASRTADRWFVSILVEREHEAPAPTSTQAVGIDLGLKTSLVLSTGEEIQAPRPLKAALRKLRRAQKAVARSQRNSASRRKKVAKVARIHMRVANIRRDWQHTTSDRLTREFAAIGVEGLAVKGLANRKRKAGRSWADLGAGELLRQITYKSGRRGVVLVVADRFYPSTQLCSACGHRQPMPLKERTYRCGSCGLVLDRDQNAARNLCPVADTPSDTPNAGGGDVSPGSAWRMPMKPEQPGSSQRWVRAGADGPIPVLVAA
ncbi:MAG: RNA-guided endonuclease TnpB family protein [Chloroflexota bacterium]